MCLDLFLALLNRFLVEKGILVKKIGTHFANLRLLNTLFGIRDAFPSITPKQFLMEDKTTFRFHVYRSTKQVDSYSNCRNEFTLWEKALMCRQEQ